MKKRTNATKLLATVALLTVILYPCTSGSASPRGTRTGMFGLARGDVARINVANVGDPNVGPIVVEMQFLDSMGNLVATRSETLTPGRAAFFDAPFDIFHTEGNRVETRAVIMSQGPPGLDKNLTISIEVFDAEAEHTIYMVPIRNLVA